MRSYAFLDRDGTLVPERSDEAWRGVTQVELMPGVAEALRALDDLGYALVVVTNQYLIGEGIITADQYRSQTQSLASALGAEGIRLTDVMHCPHPRTARCPCHKPGTAMATEAIRRHGAMNPARSFVVGDALSDAALAAALNITGFLLPGDDPRTPLPTGAIRVPTLAAALPFLQPCDPTAT